MIVSLIAAISLNRGIGQRGRMPWHLPSDLQRFKQLTMGHHLIVGRKTWEAIGRPLPGRTMLVITRQLDYEAKGCVVLSSLEAALQYARDAGESEVFIAGGGEIYALAMSCADRLYITRLQRLFEVDTYFPQIDPEKFQLESVEAIPADEHNLAYDFEVWGRL